MKQFRIIKEKTQDHWLELEGSDEGCGTVEKDGSIKPIWNVRAICQWDGCVHLNKYSNGYDWRHKHEEDCDTRGCLEEYTHICDIDDEIAMLQEIKRQAIEFFKGKTGEEYWNPLPVKKYDHTTQGHTGDEDGTQTNNQGKRTSICVTNEAIF